MRPAAPELAEARIHRLLHLSQRRVVEVFSP